MNKQEWLAGAPMEVLVRELQRVQHSGVNAVGDDEAPNLLGAGDADGPDLAHRRQRLAERLQRVITRLPEPNQSVGEPLFGLGRHSQTGLGRRHEAVLKAAGLDRSDWDKYRRGQMLRLFRTVAELLASEAEEPRQGGGHKSGYPFAYETVSLSVEYIPPTDDDASFSIVQTRKIRSNVPELRGWHQTFTSESESMVGPPRFKLVGHGKLRYHSTPLSPKDPSAGYISSVETTFSEPVAYDREIEFSMVRSAPVDPQKYWAGRGLHYYYVVTPTDSIHSLDIAVQFDAAHSPTRVRRLDGVWPSRRLDGNPDDPGEETNPDAGRVRWNWNQPQLKMSYGFAWELTPE